MSEGGKTQRRLGKPSEDVCREVLAHGLAGREACRAVGEKLAGGPVGEVWCTTWLSYRDGVQVAIVPDLPDDAWYPLDRERLRSLLERRLGEGWEQPRVQRELEAVGFSCGMTNHLNGHVIDMNSPPRFVCIAQVGSTIASTPSAKAPLLAYGLDIRVEVQFARQGGAAPLAEDRGDRRGHGRLLTEKGETFEKHL